MLMLCSPLIWIACNSGVPEQISVESCWKKLILSSRVTFLCGLLDSRAWAMNQSSKAMGATRFGMLWAGRPGVHNFSMARSNCGWVSSRIGSRNSMPNWLPSSEARR